MSEDLTTTEGFNATVKVYFSGHLDISVTSVQCGVAEAEMRLGPQHLAPTGSMHGAAVVGIADEVCDTGCQCSKPDGTTSVTTIELKRSFLGITTSGLVTCDARMNHSGRNTQVWDVDVAREYDKIF